MSFSPPFQVLQQLEKDKTKPLEYAFGTSGPDEAKALLKRLGYNDFTKVDGEKPHAQHVGLAPAVSFSSVDGV